MAGLYQRFEQGVKELNCNRPKCLRPVKEEQEDIDNRKQRTILGYDGSEIFRELDKGPDSHAAEFHGYSNWVVLESFNALNKNANHLEEEESEDSWRADVR